MNTAQIIPFQFKTTQIRTIADDNGEPWFIAADVCCILGYRNTSKAITDHCRAGGITKRYTPTESGEQEMVFINEGNLYRLIIKSRKPEAEPFESWVCDEVLPAIRKTGRYEAPPAQKPKAKSKPKELPGGLTINQQDIMKQMVLTKTKDLPPEKLPGGIIKCWGALKSHFGMTYKAISPEQFPEAVSLLARLDLDGELIERHKPSLDLDYSVERWLRDNPWFKPHVQKGPDGKPRMAVQAFMVYGMDSNSAINQLIRELARDGHNMEACRVELFALRHFMEVYRHALADVARVSSVSLERTIGMGFEPMVA